MKGLQQNFQNRGNERNALCVRALRLVLGRGGERFVRYGDVYLPLVGFRDDDAE